MQFIAGIGEARLDGEGGVLNKPLSALVRRVYRTNAFAKLPPPDPTSDPSFAVNARANNRPLLAM